jgi:cytochrome c553
MENVMRARLLVSVASAALLGSCLLNAQGTHSDAGRHSDAGSGGDSSACMPDAEYFQKQVWNRVVATRCATCHSEGGVAEGTRIVYKPAAEDGAMQSNLEAAKGMALATEEGQPLLLRRPSGINHTGGLVVMPDSAEYQALADFTARVRGERGACEAKTCEPGDPGPRLLRRLTRAEYDSTLSDVFGIQARFAAELVADEVVYGFDNNARALTVAPLLADQLRKAAENVAAQVAAKPAYACAGDGATCAKAFLEGGAARVFRRPLTAAEVVRWLAVYTVGSQTAPAGTSAHQSGMELLISGLLQSPAFLYRSELGEDDGAGGYVLSSYEIASELSYLLWAAPPDDELWNAAASGSLKDPAAIATQAKRLLASPRARASLDRFTSQWLTVAQLGFIAKDATLYPDMSAEIRAAMAEEVARLVASVAQGGGNLKDLFTSKKTSVNAALAKFYGIDAPAAPDSTGFGEVTGRQGLLGTGAVLAAHARPNGSSPIARGKLVREQILCGILPTPPSGVVAQPPAADPNQTTRQRYAAHSNITACNSCHRLVDPLGWAFEHYDGVGRYRATEDSLPIDDSGEILATTATDGTYDGLDELSQRLANSDEVASCFALHWTRYAFALKENAQTFCLTDDVRSKFVQGGAVISDLLVSLTQTSQFRVRGPDSAQPDSTPDAGLGGADAGSGGSDAGASQADAGSGQADAGSGQTDAGMDPLITSEVIAQVTRTNTWNTGYCATINISNPSNQAVTWRVAVTLEGTMRSHYNFDIVSQSGSTYTVTGVSYNASVPAGGALADIGFCADL